MTDADLDNWAYSWRRLHKRGQGTEDELVGNLLADCDLSTATYRVAYVMQYFSRLEAATASRTFVAVLRRRLTLQAV